MEVNPGSWAPFTTKDCSMLDPVDRVCTWSGQALVRVRG